MAEILSSGNSASYPDVSLSRWKCARKGRREGDRARCTFPWSPAVHHQSLAWNLCKGHFPCHCDRNYQNSPLQFIRRAHLIQFFTEISFWPTTVYFNNYLNQNHNKILLSYWLSLAPDSALIIRVVKQNRTTVYRFCYLISWLYFVNTSPR